MSMVKNSAPGPKPTDDLGTASRAVVDITHALSTQLQMFLEMDLPNAANSDASIISAVRALAAQLRERLPAAVAKFRPVLGEFEAARGRTPSVHGAALASVEGFCRVAEGLPSSGLAVAQGAIETWIPYVLGERQSDFRANPSLDRNTIQRWLTSVRLRVGACLADTAPQQPELMLERAGAFGLAAEFRQAELCRSRQARSQCQVQCVEVTRAVLLDGIELASGLPPDVFRFVQALAKATPDPIPFKRIRRLHGVKEQNSTRLRTKIPAELARYVKGSTRGFFFDLGAVPAS